MNPITIYSIYVGQPQTMTDEKGEWSSSIYRTLVEGPIKLGERGLEGDRVTNTKHHGHPYQAVCCHAMDHYDFWNAHYEIAGTDKALGPSSVGENWTLEDRPAPGITLRYVNETVFQTKDAGAAREILESPALAANWKNALKRLK